MDRPGKSREDEKWLTWKELKQVYELMAQGMTGNQAEHEVRMRQTAVPLAERHRVPEEGRDNHGAGVEEDQDAPWTGRRSARSTTGRWTTGIEAVRAEAERGIEELERFLGKEPE